ncbi:MULTISPECIES: hypothetical protein [Leptolyngbya]|uniref:hypothetical protein n=1 Tax=Leptolyngbya TaxID=47251 RepID=UPI0016873CB7|nr:hypothetical protein [Leptolyngbya sp. FACHB-1624]MBD1859282.1 hypothetical protein [Leptolyngbya sp. FACHB-1624]
MYRNGVYRHCIDEETGCFTDTIQRYSQYDTEADTGDTELDCSTIAQLNYQQIPNYVPQLQTEINR